LSLTVRRSVRERGHAFDVTGLWTVPLDGVLEGP